MKRVTHHQYFEEAPRGARPKRGGIVWKILLGLVVAVLPVGGIGYGVDYFMSKDKVPRGTSVSGIDIGGLTKETAAQRLDARLGQRVSQPFTVQSGDLRSTIDPRQAGLRPDWDATVQQASAKFPNPIAWLKSFRQTRKVEIEGQVNSATLDPELGRVRQELTREPKDAQVNIDGGKVNTTPEAQGQTVPADVLDREVRREWLNEAGVRVEPTITRPAITDEAVKKVADGDAKKALSGPIVVRGRDHVDGIIPPERMAEVVRFVPKPEEHALSTEVDSDAAKKILEEKLGDTTKEKRNATVSFAGHAKQVTPHSDGVRLDWDKMMKDFDKRVIGDEKREFEAVYIDEPATFRTEDAEKATFDDTIGEFTTGGFSPTSGVNIRRVAEMVDGAMVAPGDTFSLNGYTGPRGKAQGFVDSGVILNGRSDKAVGGGISQFSTTLFNAAYFAGMEDVEHQPHSYYISRYPAGREATVYEGAIDLKFKNTSKYPVLIETQADEKNVTVRLKGVKQVTVESINGGRWNQTQPKEQKVDGKDCSPSSGAPGFSTSDTRVIKDLQGKEIKRETFNWTYDPVPIVHCS